MLIPQSHGLICTPSNHLSSCLLQDAGVSPLNADMEAGHDIFPSDAPVFAHDFYGFLECADLLLAVELVVCDILAGALLPSLSKRPAKDGLVRLIVQKGLSADDYPRPLIYIPSRDGGVALQLFHCPTCVLSSGTVRGRKCHGRCLTHFISEYIKVTYLYRKSISRD